MRRCHVRKKDPLKFCHVYNLFFWKTVRYTFGRFFLFIKTQTQTMYSQSKVKLTLTSVSLRMNTLNTDACDTEIEEEEKKKKKPATVRSLARIIPLESEVT